MLMQNKRHLEHSSLAYFQPLQFLYFRYEL